MHPETLALPPTECQESLDEPPPHARIRSSIGTRRL
jgi:hypothetical protein